MAKMTHLLNVHTLAKMKPTASLINSARGLLPTLIAGLQALGAGALEYDSEFVGGVRAGWAEGPRVKVSR